MADQKYCPMKLSSDAESPHKQLFYFCEKEKCSWWFASEEKCSRLVAAESLYQIANSKIQEGG